MDIVSDDTNWSMFFVQIEMARYVIILWSVYHLDRVPDNLRLETE